MCTTTARAASEQVTDGVRHGKRSVYYTGGGHPVCVGEQEEMSNRTTQEKVELLGLWPKTKCLWGCRTQIYGKPGFISGLK